MTERKATPGPSREGLSWSEDFAVILGTIATLEGLKFAFGWQVATAVAVTALIGCIAFLYYAGREARGE